MAEAAFNMIAETRRLRDAGLPQEQAEAVTLAIHAGVTGGVATRADVEALKGAVNRDIEALRGDVRALDAKVDALDTKIDGLGDRLDARVDGLGDRLDTELKWIRAIGGVIVAILVLPWLAGLLGAGLPVP